MKEAALKGSGFDFAYHELDPSLILSIEGLDKEGKTDLALTAPDPILLQGLDLGHRGVVEKFQRAGKRIGISTYPYKLDPKIKKEDGAGFAKQEAYIRENVWGPFERDFKAAIAAGARTIVWDTATEVWELLRLAHFGKLAQVPEQAYAIVNAEYKELVRLASSSRVTLILLHQLKEEYENFTEMTPNGPKEKRKRTGKYIRAGMNKIGFLVDAYVRCQFIPPKKKKDGVTFVDGEEGVGRFTQEILRCRDNAGAVGMTFTNADFLTLASMVRPDVDLDAWYKGSSGIIRPGVTSNTSDAGNSIEELSVEL